MFLSPHATPVLRGRTGPPDTKGRCDEAQGHCACLSSYLALGERPRAVTAQLACTGSSVLLPIVSGALRGCEGDCQGPICRRRMSHIPAPYPASFP